MDPTKKKIGTSPQKRRRWKNATSPKLHRSYYPHRSRDSVSPVCGIFYFNILRGNCGHIFRLRFYCLDVFHFWGNKWNVCLYLKLGLYCWWKDSKWFTYYKDLVGPSKTTADFMNMLIIFAKYWTSSGDICSMKSTRNILLLSIVKRILLPSLSSLQVIRTLLLSERKYSHVFSTS